MPDFHYGPTHIYEVTWWSGLVERIVAHQVNGGPRAPDREILGASTDRTRRVCFYAQIDGKWMLQLNAMEADIRTIRRVATEADALPDAK